MDVIASGDALEPPLAAAAAELAMAATQEAALATTSSAPSEACQRVVEMGLASSLDKLAADGGQLDAAFNLAVMYGRAWFDTRRVQHARARLYASPLFINLTSS